MSFDDPDHLHTAFAQAFQDSDVAALVDLYEAGAVQVQQDGTTVTGGEALRAVFEKLLAAGLTMQGEAQPAVVAGDIALTSTHYAFPAADGGVTRVATAEVSRRQPDGSWRVVVDAPAFA